MAQRSEYRTVELPCGHRIGVDPKAPEQDPATYDCGMCQLRGLPGFGQFIRPTEKEKKHD